MVSKNIDSATLKGFGRLRSVVWGLGGCAALFVVWGLGGCVADKKL